MPPAVLIALITSPTVVAPLSETLIFVPSEVVTAKSGLARRGGRHAVAVVELAQREWSRVI